MRSNAVEEIKDKFSTKKLNKNQEKIVDNLVEAIVSSSHSRNWTRQMKSCIKDYEKIEKLSPLNEVLEISAKHELASYPAAILWHSKK